MPQLNFASGYSGRFRTHKKAAPLFTALFQAWEQADLLHLIMSYEGCFVPRYKRNQAPAGSGGHGLLESKNVPALSNHSFGSAFDIKLPDGETAHTACLGFGLERVVMALFKTHGFDPRQWPVAVRAHLWP